MGLVVCPRCTATAEDPDTPVHAETVLETCPQCAAAIEAETMKPTPRKGL